MRSRRLIVPALACLASFGLAAGATAALRASLGDRGPTGPRGLTGKRGPTGRQPVLVTPFSINWQNGQWRGRSSISYDAPGLGRGTVTCSPPTPEDPNGGAQMVVFQSEDPKGTDMSMTSVRTDDRPFTYNQGEPDAQQNPTSVKIGNLTRFTGAKTNEGFNLKPFTRTARAQGSMTGIISARGPRGKVGGPVDTPPTTFRLSWHWVFDDGNPRCYVAGAFYTEAS